MMTGDCSPSPANSPNSHVRPKTSQTKDDPLGLLALCWSVDASIAVDLYRDGTAIREHKLDKKERDWPGQNIEWARYHEEDCLHKGHETNQPAPAGDEATVREGDQEEPKAQKQQQGLDHIHEYL